MLFDFMQRCHRRCTLRRGGLLRALLSSSLREAGYLAGPVVLELYMVFQDQWWSDGIGERAYPDGYLAIGHAGLAGEVVSFGVRGG
jgi:hypothetical protein